MTGKKEAAGNGMRQGEKERGRAWSDEEREIEQLGRRRKRKRGNW